MQRASSPIVVPKVKCGKSLLSQPLDLGRYFRSKQISSPFKFASVSQWENFDYVLKRNLERVRDFEQPSRFMTTQELALVVITPLLVQMGLRIKFVERRPETFPFIGSADLILCELTNVVGKPLLIGRNYSDLALEFDIVSYLQGFPSTQREINYFGDSVKDAEVGKNEVSRAIQDLCHVMLVNDLAFGYLSSECSTRFVMLVPKSSGIELQISYPINSHQVCEALAAISLEAYYGHPYLRYYHGFDALPEALEDPNIEPLSSFDKGSAGKIKWWVANRVNRQKYTISIDHRAPNDTDPSNIGTYLPDENTGVFRFGLVTVDNNIMLPSVLKICTDETLVRHEASMLQYLLEKGSSRIPKLILYAHILENDFHILSLEPFGRQMIPDDLLVPQVEELMLTALDEVHMFGVMLIKVTIESFAFEYKQSPQGMMPKVKIVSFTKAKLYRRIPEVARKRERSLLWAAIAEFRSQISRPLVSV